MPQAGPAAHESQAGPLDALLWPTAKADSSFFMLVEPHLAQVCLVALRLV